MIGLTDAQLQIVMDAAAGMAPEKRDVFLQRVGAILKQRGRHFTDDDLADVTKLASAGLVHATNSARPRIHFGPA